MGPGHEPSERARHRAAARPLLRHRALAEAGEAEVGDLAAGVDRAVEAHVGLRRGLVAIVAVGIAIGRLGIAAEAAVDQADNAQVIAVGALNGADGGDPRLAGVGLSIALLAVAWLAIARLAVLVLIAAGDLLLGGGGALGD